ncbi:DUF3817 domain-containing protein [Sporichthya polymorpha]|uniref:DUF3817 domain-containing protein n=1 Tax=Sporichthya polymorpha TaxID=35751 RepID=UPI00036A4F9F|nr:DUF3817 domain-containing protein [Sporichthya polymorpha]
MRNTPATRYQVAAYIVGVLLLLVCVEMVMAYGFGNKSLKWVVFAHGYFYILYLVLAFDFFRRYRWPLRRLAEMILAGVVPGMTFLVERRIARLAEETPARLDGSGAAAL